ncbi:MAG: hypothetical protein WD226_02680 [Planctomycetota bacterium]
MRCLTLLSTLVLVAPAVRAADIHVHPTSPDALQLAIDAAAPGDTLFIHGGTYSAITITKPLELVADPVASVEGVNTPSSPQWVLQRPITMAGPNAGTVTLQNIRTVGVYNVTIHFARAEPLVKVDGFDRAVFIGCDIREPQYIADGHIDGAPAIQATAPEVFLFDCTIRALNPATAMTAVPGTRPAIDAANSTVIASDCDIEGGFFPFIILFNCTQPAPPDALGAAGVVADRLFQTGGSIRGGRGPMLFCSGGTPPPTLPPGPAFIVNQRVVQRHSLDQLTRPTVGGTWRIDVTTGKLGALLIVGHELGALNFDPALGWNLFSPSRILAYLPVAPTDQHVELSIPPWATAFAGIDWLAALYDHDEGRLGGPVMAKLY